MSARSFLFHSLALALALCLAFHAVRVNAQTDLRVTSADTLAGRTCDGMANLDLIGYDAGASYNSQKSSARDCGEFCRSRPGLACGGWVYHTAGSNAGLCVLKVNVPTTATYTATANRTSGFVPGDSYACSVPAPAPVAVSGFSQPLWALGCWQDFGNENPSSRVLPHSSGDYRGADPIGNCLQFAISQGDSYFALQYGTQCFSGSNYQRPVLPFNGSITATVRLNMGCSMPCPGAPSLYCGGNMANQVYSRIAPAPVNPVNCVPFAWSATTAAPSSLPFGNSSAVTPSWSVSCFPFANATIPCASNFTVGLYDSATDELVKTLFAPAADYCPAAGAVSVGSAFGAPDGSYAGKSYYLQAKFRVGSVVVPVGEPLRYTVVCPVDGSGDESTVSVPGLRYTGAQSGSSGEFLSVEATLPFVQAAGLPVSGQLSFTLANGAACSTPTSVVGALSVGSCRLDAPVAAGVYNVTVRFEAQNDRCSLFTAQTSTSITVFNLQAMQAQADSTAAALTAEVTRATNALNVEIFRATAAEAAVQDNVTREVADRKAADVVLSAQVSAEVKRANSTELELRSLIKDLTATVNALTARVVTLERPAAYLFFGLSNALSVSYPAGQQPGSGPSNLLQKALTFDTPLSSLGSDSLSYSSSSGVLRIDAAGTYRFDAFVHLYVSKGNTVGTGVVSWQTLAGRPIGPNVLNENSNGIAQGVPGDDSIVSSLRTISATELPFFARLVLVSMNQKDALITDASVLSVTRVR